MGEGKYDREWNGFLFTYVTYQLKATTCFDTGGNAPVYIDQVTKCEQLAPVTPRTKTL